MLAVWAEVPLTTNFTIENDNFMFSDWQAKEFVMRKIIGLNCVKQEIKPIRNIR